MADLARQASGLNSPEKDRVEPVVLSSREVWSHSSLQTLLLSPGQVVGSSNFILSGYQLFVLNPHNHSKTI